MQIGDKVVYLGDNRHFHWCENVTIGEIYEITDISYDPHTIFLINDNLTINYYYPKDFKLISSEYRNEIIDKLISYN